MRWICLSEHYAIDTLKTRIICNLKIVIIKIYSIIEAHKTNIIVTPCVNQIRIEEEI